MEEEGLGWWGWADGPSLLAPPILRRLSLWENAVREQVGSRWAGRMLGGVLEDTWSVCARSARYGAEREDEGSEVGLESAVRF